jgi:predicted metalloprotease
MAASILEIDENAILKELKMAETNSINNYSPQIPKKNVTNSLQFEEKVQKNLLSVFISDGGCQNYEKLNLLLPENIIRDETLIIVKNTIDKLMHTVNNVRELTKNLYTEFIEDDNLTKIITDLVDMSEAFNELSTDELEQTIQENIYRLNKCYSEHETEQLRQQYRQVNDDDTEALKLQMQLRDKIKLKTGDK